MSHHIQNDRALHHNLFKEFYYLWLRHSHWLQYKTRGMHANTNSWCSRTLSIRLVFNSATWQLQHTRWLNAHTQAKMTLNPFPIHPHCVAHFDGQQHHGPATHSDLSCISWADNCRSTKGTVPNDFPVSKQLVNQLSWEQITNLCVK